MRKRFLMLICLMLCAALLAGCASGPAAGNETSPTLPPAESAYSAPDGDQLDHTGAVALYMPTADRQRLVVRYTDAAISAGDTNARTAVEQLLRQDRDEITDTVGGDVRMNLYSDAAVNVAGGVCTVSLTPSALAMSPQALYVAALSITSTLCALSDISAVNILVADMAPGMDVAGNLPLGTMTARPGEQLDVLWDAFDARRTPLGEDPSAMPLTTTATLYLPLADGSGVIPQTRTMNFPGQTPQQLAQTLLQALSQGSQYNHSTCVMPDITSLMTEPPQASDMLQGGRLITLRFKPQLTDTLEALGIPQDSFLTSLTLTVTTFVPNVSAMQVIIDDAPVTSAAGVTFRSGLIRRADLAGFIRSEASIAVKQDGRLVFVNRTVSAGRNHDPRTMLRCLMDGVTDAQAQSGMTDPLPAGMNDNDLLGFSLQGDTLCVNMSERFRAAVIRWGKENERLLCYSMVNTLCAATGARRVAFFFEDQPAELLAGTVYWGGTFLPMQDVRE